MTCIWNKIFSKNAGLLKKRFPELYTLLEPQFQSVLSLLEQEEAKTSREDDLQILNNIFSFWNFSLSKSGELTVKEDSVFLHSSYSPIKETERLFNRDEISDPDIPWLFPGIGLGYAPVNFAKRNRDSLMIIIEPDPGFLFAALSVTDFEPVFNHEKCVIITSSTPEQILPLLENLKVVEKNVVITNNSQTKHQLQWFKNFFTLLERNRQKQNINNSTLEKFSSLWLKNSSRNLKYFCSCQPISIYKNMLNKKVPAFICAAGPTLEEAVPHIKEIQKRFVIIAVDTALRTLLKNGIEPDFILLIDPQYYAACHLEGLKSKSSVLVTESSVYPSVMRFDCRKKVLCESLFPLGRYFETKLLSEKSFGKIIAGGSVSTSCWDFAKYIGASAIYMAGLDLGYPQKKTHIKGSTFEEKSHTLSTRLKSAENNLCSILFSAANEKSVNYLEEEIITDSKMKLFAWWFESQIAKEPQLTTYSLSAKSLKIPGMKIADYEMLNAFPECRMELSEIIFTAEKKEIEFSQADFNQVLENLKSCFEELYSLSKKGFSICSKILSLPQHDAIIKAKESFSALSQIDSKILSSEAKTVASLVFPTERQLDSLMQEEPVQTSSELKGIVKSKVIYQELLKAISQYQKNLK